MRKLPIVRHIAVRSADTLTAWGCWGWASLVVLLGECLENSSSNLREGDVMHLN